MLGWLLHSLNGAPPRDVRAALFEESRMMQLLELIRIEMLRHQAGISERNYGKTSLPSQEPFP
jgi:hypothetical protein